MLWSLEFEVGGRAADEEMRTDGEDPTADCDEPAVDG